MSEAEANPLLHYYHRYIGDPDRTIDVYAGFGLFFFGLGLGVAAVVIFLYSATLPEISYTLRQLAVVTGAIGAPMLLGGIVVLLPVDRRMLVLASVGTVICAIGIGRFVSVYPSNFNTTVNTDYAAQVVGIYSSGIVVVIAATAAALVAHQIERTATNTAVSADPEDSTEDDTTVDDEQVQADIDRELEDTELSWGGVERTETRRLTLDTSAVDDVDSASLPDGAETRTDDGRVDDAVAQLSGLQGGEVETTSGESTDDQATALRELREQQRADEEADSDTDGLVDRLRNLF
jgi:hypothetical protein